VEVKPMDDGVLLGQTAAGEDVVLTYGQRRQQTYIIGVNGTGKTTLLRQIAHSDMRQDPKHGLCVIDPHGDLIDDIIAMVPEDRLDDVILFNPSNEEHPFCLNLFAPVPAADELGRVASEIVAIFRKIFGAAWTPEIEGVVQNVTLTLLSRPADFPSKEEPWVPAMDEIPALLAMERVEEGDEKQPPWRRRVQTYRSQFYQLLQQQDQIPVWEFWNYSFDPLTPRPRSELTFAVLNQVRRFLANPAVRNVVGQTQSKLDLSKVISEGKILLVNLSKGKLGEANSAFLGSVIVAKLVVAVFARANDAPESRRPFHIICDEFQNFAISSFPMLLSEARKYNVDLVIAHQYRDQLRDWVQGATVNAGNILCFRVGGDDAFELAREFDATPPPPEDDFQPIYSRHLAGTQAKLAKNGAAAVDALRRARNGEPVSTEELAIARQWLMDWCVLQPRLEERLTAFAQSPKLVLSEAWITRLEDIYKLIRPTSGALDGYAQKRVVYPETPGTYHRSYSYGWSRSSAGESKSESEGHSESSETGPLFERVPGRPRPYSDVYQQIANGLTHLPNFHARCRLSGSDSAAIEQTFRTIEWPDGHEDAAERQRRHDSNEKAIRDKTHRHYTRPRAEVTQEFQKRYETMLKSIGMTWSRGQPLPKPEILYDEDD
jgi:hypothetical protein